MNDWYIDRSKNFINDSFDLVLNYLETYDGERDSSSIISALIENEILSEETGNPNAALTRFRDHGLIDNNNMVGNSVADYLHGLITKNELIIDLFSKRPARKKKSANIKPFILLCCAFDLMFEVAACDEDLFLTFSECYKYLYPCNSLEELSPELIDVILNNRKYSFNSSVPDFVIAMKQNEMTNLSIWFNALKHTSIFIPSEDRAILRPNIFQRDFFKFIALNGHKISETPTDNNTNLYNYYCDRRSGLIEIIPYVFKPNIVFRDEEEIEIVLEYLFGIKKTVDFDFKYYFIKECFGIYHAFITIPNLVIRAIYVQNKSIANEIWSHFKRKI